MTEATPQSLVLGIDLGTTNSVCAVMGRRGPVVLRDRDGEALVPSVVAYDGDRIVVGRAARDMALLRPDAVVHSSKRLIGRSYADLADEARRLPYRIVAGERGLPRIVPAGGRGLAPEEVSAQVLAEVKRLAEQALGQTVAEVVVTVPAYFDDAQRQATKDAAELAGLRCLRIVNEPTAAALAYGIDGSQDGTVLVFDLGGGTFDVSILRIEDGVFRVLATAGDTRLGGDDFDRAIEDHLLAQLAQRGLVAGTADDLDPLARQALRQAAERLKIALSAEAEAALTVDLGARGSAEVALDRATFEARIEPMVERAMSCCRAALRDAEVTAADIDHVLLVGGSTRVPLVRRRLQHLVGREPRADVDPDLAVALGAAVQADVLAGGNRSLLLLDVIPLSLGIETMGGAMSKLILRNTTIPTSATEEFSTQADGQTGVDINIFQGERELVRDCRHLGSFRLLGIPPMPAGLPRVAVTFLVDADGLLTVTAEEQRTGQQASIRVVPSFGLTRDEVRRMMQESIEHAAEDVQAREAIELRNKAQAMVRGTTRALELADLPPDQVYSVKKATAALAAAVDGGAAVDALRAAIDRLSALTAQIADDVVSSAVSRALAEEPER